MAGRLMASRQPGIGFLERLEAILQNPLTYELGDLIPDQVRRGGRQRMYPAFMFVVYEALVSVYGSARQVEAELRHPIVWKLVRRIAGEMRPEAPLPNEPMRRYHYLYSRERYLVPLGHVLRERFEQISAAQARCELGLCDPDGVGSLTHPDLSRTVHADGKVLAPLFRAKPGERTVDEETGEITTARHEPDAALHVTGGGQPAYGTKWVLGFVRDADPHTRMVVGLQWVPNKGGEAKHAMAMLERIAPNFTGAQGLIYDTALRGVHLQKMLTELGWVPIVPVAAKSVDGKKRRPKEAFVEATEIEFADGTKSRVKLFSRDGALGVIELDVAGESQFVELPRRRLIRRRNRTGWRWYGEYDVQHPNGGESARIRVRLDLTDEDQDREFNRPENLRAIPPDDPDYARLYSRRSDAEAANRILDDTHYLRRAHSVGHERQLVNLIGFGLAVNSIALAQARQRAGPVGIAA